VYVQDFEYEDEGDDEEAQDAGIENKYYLAKSEHKSWWSVAHCSQMLYTTLGNKDDNPDDAIREMENVVDMEEEKGDW
jgi:COP9 signalosome complex subunit 2